MLPILEMDWRDTQRWGSTSIEKESLSEGDGRGDSSGVEIWKEFFEKGRCEYCFIEIHLALDEKL